MRVQSILPTLFLLISTGARAQEITPGSNLVVDGIPKIPASLAEEVGRYTKSRAAELLSWHPQKREMLIATTFAETPQLHRVTFPGGARTQLTFFADRPTRGVSYQPTNGDYFIFRKDVGGDQNYQNYRYDFSTGTITLLTDGKSKNGPAVWSKAGDRIDYTSTRRTGKDTDIWIVNPRDPRTDRLLLQLEGGGWDPLDWSPDDRSIILMETISVNESYLWLFDIDRGTRKLITPKDGAEKVSYNAARFRTDGKGLYLVTDRGSEFQRLASLDLGTGRYEFVTDNIPWDITEFEPSPDGKLLAVVANEAGLTVLHVIDAVTGKEKELTKMPDGGVIGIHWRGSGELGFSLDSARDATDAY
jgi:Tol biopolymer transport system component